jgi:hypothetical protein
MPQRTNYLLITLLIVASFFPLYFFSFVTKDIAYIDSHKQLAQAAPTLSNGLVAHYKFDEGSGTTAIDSAGSNNGTLTNGPTFTAGKVGGGALSFDGTNDYVWGGTVGFLSFSGSISTWVRHDRQSSVDEYFFNHRAGAGDSRIYLFVLANTDNLMLSLGNTVSVDTTADLIPGQWHHFVLNWSGGTYNIYFDNVLIKSGSYVGMNSISNCFTLGKAGGSSCTGTSNYWGGALDDFRVYDRILNTQEISDLYSLTSTPPPSVINGQCSAILNNCDFGTFSDIADSSTQYFWNCIGSGGGVTAVCSLSIPVGGNSNQKPSANMQLVDVIKDNSKNIVLTGSDPEGSQLSFVLLTNPTNGSLSKLATDSTGATYTYVPKIGYIGGDSFTFKVNDGSIDSDHAMVSITVAVSNTPPAVSVISGAVDVDLAKIGTQVFDGTKVTLTSSVSDIDNDPLSWILSYKLNGGSEVIFSSGSGSVGSVVFDSAGKIGSYEWILISLCVVLMKPSLKLYSGIVSILAPPLFICMWLPKTHLIPFAKSIKKKKSKSKPIPKKSKRVHFVDFQTHLLNKPVPAATAFSD